MSDFVRSLLSRGIGAAKAGEAAEARRYLERALEQPDVVEEERMQAWHWLSEVISDPLELRGVLEEILVRNPLEPRARRKLAILNGELEPEDIIDPEAVPAQDTDEVEGDARRFTCPTCGGRMTFEPDGVSLMCEYCDSSQQLPSGRDENDGEQDFTLAMATVQGHWKPAADRSLRCEGCGARFVLPPEQLSINCPYCQSTYVLATEETGDFVAPAAIIPFAVELQQVMDAIRGWLAANLPKDAKARVLGGSALYLPVWAFRVGGNLPWRGFYESKNSGQKLRMLEGSVDAGQQEVLIPAGSKLFSEGEQELQAYDMSALVPFEEDYLANWAAETYQIPVAQAALEARARFFRIRAALARQELHAVQDLNISSAELRIESFRLLLLPAWISRFRFEEREYPLFINGQTGAVRGERPARGMGKLIDSLLGLD